MPRVAPTFLLDVVEDACKLGYDTLASLIYHEHGRDKTWHMRDPTQISELNIPYLQDLELDASFEDKQQMISLDIMPPVASLKGRMYQASLPGRARSFITIHDSPAPVMQLPFGKDLHTISALLGLLFSFRSRSVTCHLDRETTLFSQWDRDPFFNLCFCETLHMTILSRQVSLMKIENQRGLAS